MWDARNTIKRSFSAETTIIDEKIPQQVQKMIFGPEYEFLVYEDRLLVKVQLSLYQSQAKKKSRAKSTKKLTGYQVAVKISAEITEKGEKEDGNFLDSYSSFSELELFTEQSVKSKRKMFRLEIGEEEPSIWTFDNVGIREDDDQMILYIGLNLQYAYNRRCHDYAGLVNHGKTTIFKSKF